MPSIIPVTPPAEAGLVPCHYAVDITDGTARTFGEGATFTVQAGWAGEWRVDKPFRKYFALSVPQAGAR